MFPARFTFVAAILKGCRRSKMGQERLEFLG
jgi:hypothetical protein